jgi:hypothetical protein
VSVDALVLRNATDLSAVSCACPLVVTGMHLEGAAFDGRVLTAVARNAPAATPLPPVALAWVVAGASEGQLEGVPTLKIPVYSRTDREVELLELEFPARSASAVNELVLAGAAAFIGA